MNNDNRDNSILFLSYEFEFEKRLTKRYRILLNSKDLTYINDKTNNPEWTKLEYFMCQHCPLDITKNVYCPLAISIKDIINFFSDAYSYEQVKITVEYKGRKIIKETSLQDGVGSISGVIMASSGCPILAPLKPLIRYHLPFSTIEETEYRVMSSYLFTQYLKSKLGNEPDWEMKGLKKLYNDIIILNKNVATKIADLEEHDSSINGLVVLNNFAESINFALNDEDIIDFEEIFKEMIKL